MKLCLFLLELLELGLKFAWKNNIVHLSVLLDFGSQFIEFIIEFFFIVDHLLVFLTQLWKLFV